jgi:hypothetical protein
MNCDEKVLNKSLDIVLFSSRSPSIHSPEDIPPIDSKVLDDLEQHARKVACSLDTLMETLTNKLFKVGQPIYLPESVFTMLDKTI